MRRYCFHTSTGGREYPIQGLDQGGVPNPMSRTGWGTASPAPHQETDQHSEHLLHGGRCVSCVHAGGLSCYKYFYLYINSSCRFRIFTAGVRIIRGRVSTQNFLSPLVLNSSSFIISERLCRKLFRICVPESSRCSFWMRSVKEAIHVIIRVLMPEVPRFTYLDRSSRKEVRVFNIYCKTYQWCQQNTSFSAWSLVHMFVVPYFLS